MVGSAPYFGNLSWPQAEGLLGAERKAVLLLPLGATEPHGPHAPLLTDSLISAEVCRRAVRALEQDPEIRALILPPLDYGVTRYGRAFPGAIHLEEETLQAVVGDICRSLIQQGFRHLVVVNNHFEPEQVATLHRTLDAVEEDTGVVVGYLDLTRRHRARRLPEEFQRAECHAGRYETSLVLASRPELVDQEAMSRLEAVPVNLVQAARRGVGEFKAMGLTDAYCGAPAEATAEEGQATFGHLTEMLLEIIRDLVAGRGGRDRPRRRAT